MPADLTAVNERRIGEKTQEIQLYCAQKKSSMTSRAFDMARMSFERLLNNIADRSPRMSSIIENIRKKLDSQDDYVALISEKQASALAKAIVYNYIGDDLDLYPITAEKKLQRAKARQLKECSIPIDEMTVKDILFVVSAITQGENFSKSTMLAIFEWFKEIGLDPMQARLYSVLFMKGEPMSIHSIPQYSIFQSEYEKAAKALVEKGFICEFYNGKYNITETAIS